MIETINILGVKVNNASLTEALNLIKTWLNHQSKPRYVVTPNVEFLMLAQKDKEFKEILNKADLSIPDSARFGWAVDIKNEKNLLLKILKWPLFLVPKIFLVRQFDAVTGTDLTEQLIKKSIDWAATIGFIGGKKNLAIKLKERLEKKYPSVKINFTADGGVIKTNGEMESSESLKDFPKTDILFIGFGQVKQEKWIAKFKEQLPVKVFVGVGGALDYLSGEVLRAPQLIRSLGFEWLFRLILQPWRIKRFLNLIRFVFLVPFS